MLTATTHVVPLTELGRHDVGSAGGKGANLGELVRAGFAVPDGFVVLTALYREALGAAEVGDLDLSNLGALSPTQAAQLRSVVEALTVPAELTAEIESAYRELGEGPVAVRSSATMEDLPAAAFAGQQETYLQVIGLEAVLAAVRSCWASLWGDRAVAYRRQLGYDGEPEIAVVVQRMVPAEFAGVLFTANPVTGDRNEVVIEASPGLGEAVVSGLVTPEHAVLDRSGRLRERRAGRREVVVRARAGGGVEQCEGDDEDELPEAVLSELARTGARIAQHFGCPQDVEWAYAGATVWVVQARPLTVLPPAPVPTGRIQRQAGAITAELVPTRPYPLDMTTWTVPGWFTILARMAAEVVAVRIDVARMLPEKDGVVVQLLPPQPHPTWRTLTTPLRMRSRVRQYDPAHWTADPRFGSYQQRVQELAAHDLRALRWSELVSRPGTVLDALHDMVDLRIDYLPGAAGRIIRLRALLTVLGLSSQFWPLLSGQLTQTRAANEALHGLADEVRNTPEWAAAFTSLDVEDLTRQVREDDSFSRLREAIEAWLSAFGHRETTSAALVSATTWADDPQLLLGNLRGLVGHPPAVVQELDQAGTAERLVLSRRRVRLTRTGRRILAAARAARQSMVFREDSHFHLLRLRPVLRSALLEAGRRLTEVGVLIRPDDVFHLTLDEVRGVVDPADLSADHRQRLRDIVQQRTRAREAYGRAPLISPLTLFPDLMHPPADALVSGAPGGGGQAVGPVRVIAGPNDFGRLRPGDVLVCPYTNPAWTPLFQTAAAVVADSGSFGSHAAIVAREYGIPAVMGTGNGTSVLTEGMVVRVDGDRGAVMAAEPGPARG